jgi:hypothetical protein
MSVSRVSIVHPSWGGCPDKLHTDSTIIPKKFHSFNKYEADILVHALDDYFFHVSTSDGLEIDIFVLPVINKSMRNI